MVIVDGESQSGDGTTQGDCADGKLCQESGACTGNHIPDHDI